MLLRHEKKVFRWHMYDANQQYCVAMYGGFDIKFSYFHDIEKLIFKEDWVVNLCLFAQ